MPEEAVPGPAPRLAASGLVVPFTVPRALAGLRERWDRVALAGAGPHVTILYPFLPCDALGPAERTELAAMAGGMPAFEVRFERARVAPFVRRAQRLELWCQDAAGRWRPRWRIPFGVRP